MKKKCKVCGQDFEPGDLKKNPAAEMGDFLAKEHFSDDGELCMKCLASRGELAMMYMREFN